MDVHTSMVGLERALALSERMRDAAADGAWERVTGLDRERREQLEQGWPRDMRSRPYLVAMLEHNRAVMARIRETQAELGAELAKQRGRRQALGSYMSVVRESLLP